MGKQYEVTYLRASQQRMYKDQTKVPMHSVIVEASSPAAAKISAAAPGRLILNARLLNKQSRGSVTVKVEGYDFAEAQQQHAAEAGIDDPFAVLLASREPQSPITKEQLNQAVEALIPDPDADPVPAEEPEPTIGDVLLDIAPDAEAEDIAINADLLNEIEPAQNGPVPPPAPKNNLVFELVLQNIALTPEGRKVVGDALVSAVKQVVADGQAEVRPLTVDEAQDAKKGLTVIDVAHRQGFIAGYAIGDKDGFQRGAEAMKAVFPDDEDEDEDESESGCGDPDCPSCGSVLSSDSEWSDTDSEWSDTDSDEFEESSSNVFVTGLYAIATVSGLAAAFAKDVHSLGFTSGVGLGIAALALGLMLGRRRG